MQTTKLGHLGAYQSVLSIQFPEIFLHCVDFFDFVVPAFWVVSKRQVEP